MERENIVLKRHFEIQDRAIEQVHGFSTELYHNGLSAAFGMVLYLIDEGNDPKEIRDYIINFLQATNMNQVREDAYQFLSQCKSKSQNR